jgi:hypothetical protein
MDDVLSQFTSNQPAAKSKYGNFYNKRSQTAHNFYSKTLTPAPAFQPQSPSPQIQNPPFQFNNPPKTKFDFSKPTLQLSKTVNFQDLRKEQQKGQSLVNQMNFDASLPDKSKNIFNTWNKEKNQEGDDLLDLLIDDDKTYTKSWFLLFY